MTETINFDQGLLVDINFALSQFATPPAPPAKPS